jgi:hypothetical protein
LTLSRRHFLSLAAAVPGILAFDNSISASDDAFLEDLSHRAFLFFWEHSDPTTGLVLDRVRNDGSVVPGRNLEVSSTALTGFGLTAMCIAADRRWVNPNQILERVRSTLRYFVRDQEHVRGWYYHFVNRKNGGRVWNSEISTIDTAMLLAGVITAQEYYAGDAEIFHLASTLYQRVDFNWLLDKNTGLLRMGWNPETGLFRSEWKAYDEEALLLLLGIGSPTHPLPTKCWYQPERQKVEVSGYRYVGQGPLFTQQFSQAWLPLRDLRDGQPLVMDYFQNAVVATYANRAYCLGLRGLFPHYSEKLWGITASDSEIGYVGWGGPKTRRDLDGTVVPCAPAGSLMFAPEICLPALRYMKEQFGSYVYGRYGFVDAFNPGSLWINPDVIGIDLGITLLSAENLRSGRVWRWFGQSPDVQRTIGRVFQRYS